MERTVTCRTEGCENADIPIVLEVDQLVMCGVCGEFITDIDPPVEAFVDESEEPDIDDGSDLISPVD